MIHIHVNYSFWKIIFLFLSKLLLVLFLRNWIGYSFKCFEPLKRWKGNLNILNVRWVDYCYLLRNAEQCCWLLLLKLLGNYYWWNIPTQTLILLHSPKKSSIFIYLVMLIAFWMTCEQIATFIINSGESYVIIFCITFCYNSVIKVVSFSLLEVVKGFCRMWIIEVP